MCATNCDRQQTFELPRLDRQLVWLQPLQVYHNYCPLSHALQDFSIHSEVIGRKNKKNYDVFILFWHTHFFCKVIDSGRSWIWKSLDLNSSQI